LAKVIYYLAGSPSLEQSKRVVDKARANNFLFSFAHPEARKSAEHFCLHPHRRIFIDSGAYSVWNIGETVKLAEYIAFCKRMMSIAKCQLTFAALDVIPGSKSGPKPTEAEKTKACEVGWDNYQTMKQEGVPCLMTFHQFEHKRWLTRIADDSDYFAVAPRKSRDVTTDQKRQFLEHVFNEFKGRDGLPIKRIHGLGVSSSDFMKRFPFYSVDTTAWLQSVKAHSRAMGIDGGLKTEYWTLSKWEDRARQCKVPTKYLREMLGYGEYGGPRDLGGNSGDYWLMYLAADRAVETECRITDLWRNKGVDWGDHPRHDRLPFLCNHLPTQIVET
jgi:hypothetical protein